MAPSDYYFYAGAILLIFVKKMQKKKIDYVHCPMNMSEEVLEDIIKTGCTRLPRVKPG